jgi:hypothetical protein
MGGDNFLKDLFRGVAVRKVRRYEFTRETVRRRMSGKADRLSPPSRQSLGRRQPDPAARARYEYGALSGIIHNISVNTFGWRKRQLIAFFETT